MQADLSINRMGLLGIVFSFLGKEIKKQEFYQETTNKTMSFYSSTKH